MFYVDLPSAEEIGDLNLVRADACVSIYVPTTPITPDVEQSRIQYGNLVKKAVSQLEAAGFDKRRLLLLKERFADLAGDIAFWNHQANSLAVFATPDSLRTYRMANKLTDITEVSDRFHIKPLLRAITFPHAAYVLALAEKDARLVEISADLPPRIVDVPNMPANMTEAGGKAVNKGYTGTGHREGVHGHPSFMANYIRQIDAALRPVLKGSDLPLILATTKPVESLFRSVTVASPLKDVIPGNVEHLNARELAEAARPILDTYYAEQIKDLHRVFEERTGQKRTTTDLAEAARLATFGGIDTLLFDIDSVRDGVIDDETGAIAFDAQGDAVNYDIIDEIAGRALRSGAKVLAVRRTDIPGGHDLAVISRYPL